MTTEALRLLNDLAFCRKRVAELTDYIDDICSCRVRSLERKAELIESAHSLKVFWSERLRTLKRDGKERQDENGSHYVSAGDTVKNMD